MMHIIKKVVASICNTSESVLIMNCTIAYNTYYGLKRESGTIEMLNSIVWENTSSQISGTATVTYSDVQDSYDGEGNINFHPLFKSEDTLQIVSGSLCIDAGNPDPKYNDIENPYNPGYALYPSLGGLRNDMGAHGGPGADTITTIEKDVIQIVNHFVLNQNYPNPFNPVTQIKFGLPTASKVKLEIYNALGQKVATLLNTHKPAGYHKVTFDASHLASGVYIYRLTTSSGYSQTKKMILIR